MKTKKGFTLIEVIIFFVLLAIFAAFISTYMQTTITKLNTPIENLTNTATLSSIMSDITNNYYTLTQSEKAENVLQKLKDDTDTKYQQYNPVSTFITDITSTTASESATDVLKITISAEGSGSITSYFTKP